MAESGDEYLEMAIELMRSRTEDVKETSEQKDKRPPD
jgi:hypothetical protein